MHSKWILPLSMIKYHPGEEINEINRNILTMDETGLILRMNIMFLKKSYLEVRADVIQKTECSVVETYSLTAAHYHAILRHTYLHVITGSCVFINMHTMAQCAPCNMGPCPPDRSEEVTTLLIKKLSAVMEPECPSS
jgi:hypothetical protein